MEVATMSHTGQAISLLRHEGDGFIVDASAFKEILQQSDLLDRKVVVISIVGEYRRGKSFFLNFIMRYLANQGNENWINMNSSTLKGFSWKRGMDRETDGIMMWSRAFPLGKEYAVILLDTEGTYDEDSTSKTMSHVFACSALISSLQIFNVHEKITKQTMHEIQSFAEFGRLASCAEAHHAFQNLTFLVRDWMFEEKYKFGLQGGFDYLAHWLNSDKDGVKETLANCFSHVNCYLLPYPGDNVKNGQNFSGNISDMDRRFCDHIQNIVEFIFSPQYLESKKIGGKQLKLRDFMSYFSMFAKTLNESGVEPKNLFQAQVESCNMKAKELALTTYRERLDEITQGEDPLDDLQSIHDEISKFALSIFEEQPKIGGNEHATTYKSILIHEMNMIFTKYDNANTYKKVLKSKIAEKEKELWESENKRIMEELEHKHAIETALLEQHAFKENLEKEQERQAEEFKLRIHRMEQEAATERMKMQLQFQENLEELKRNQQLSREEMAKMKKEHEKQLKAAEERTQQITNEMRQSRKRGCNIL